MNKIATRTYLNPFSGKNFYHIEIDGRSLEDMIMEVRPDLKKGIVPSLLNWLTDENERKVVWDRVIPNDGQKTKLPILMCSEDLDLWCTLIMVEVEADKNLIHWNRFGLEDSDAQTPEEIGKSIDWFSGIERLSFSREAYENMLDEFRMRLDENSIYSPTKGETPKRYDSQTTYDK